MREKAKAKYKNINKVVKMSINVCPDYSFDKINAIVDFDSDDVLHKYQLIYYDYTVYKTPLDIINNFDLDFCKNYFDGKTIYIKNLESITTSSCILKALIIMISCIFTWVKMQIQRAKCYATYFYH